MRNLSYFVSALLLYGCGGGTNTPEPVSTVTSQSVKEPTVTISSSSTTVETGQKFTLTWSSSDAASCSAGDSWTGSLSTNGTKELTTETTGNVVYSIICSSGSLSANSKVTITVTQACKNPHTASHSLDFLGVHPTPTPSNKFSSNVIRAIAFKDYFVGYHPAPGCEGDKYAKLMYSNALDKIKALNSDVVWIVNYGTWDDVTKSVWTMQPKNFQIPEHMVVYIIQEAKKRNLKVYMNWQFAWHDVNKNTVAEKFLFNLDAPLLNTVLDSLSNQIQYLAKFSQQHGVDGIGIDALGSSESTLMGVHNHKFKDIWNNKHSALIDEVRKVYSGKIVYGFTSVYHNADQRILSKVDYLHVSFTPRLTKAENSKLSVEMVKKDMLCDIERFYVSMNDTNSNVKVCGDKPINPVTGYNKLPPVMFSVMVQSRDLFFVEGWVEDGFCVEGKDNLGNNHDCIQHTYKTDFSVQAIGVEGIFQALQEQKVLNLAAVDMHCNFWLTDTLGSNYKGEGFPNLSQSIRGKPAEKIVTHWYSR